MSDAMDTDTFDLTTALHIPQNQHLHRETLALKSRVTALTTFQASHPRPAHPPSTRVEIDAEKQVVRELEALEKRLRAQLAVTRTVYRKCVMKVREERKETADRKSENDGLILGLGNLRYEEMCLRGEIAGAENYDHKYKKLPLVSVEEFIAKYPQFADASEHDLTVARIEQEYQDRVELEARRQEKLKQKQKLIAEVKKSKDDLTRLDGMVEKFVEHFEPIRKVLDAE